MAILNVTPDSFSDGGRYASIDEALRQTEQYIAEGADIIDVGGESTRPGSARVAAEEEIRRVVPIIAAIARRFDVPISIDTSKGEVAARAVEAGAEIINDVSGLRFDETVGEIAARFETGLVLMHLRGRFETMHKQEPVKRLAAAVVSGLNYSVAKATFYGVRDEAIVLDVGIGFGKSFEQNLELIARLDDYRKELFRFPLLVGASRKSFIGRILDGAPAEQRLSGSLAAAAIAVWNGASVVRVHDVRETVETLRVVEAIKSQL